MILCTQSQYRVVEDLFAYSFAYPFSQYLSALLLTTEEQYRSMMHNVSPVTEMDTSTDVAQMFRNGFRVACL